MNVMTDKELYIELLVETIDYFKEAVSYVNGDFHVGSKTQSAYLLALYKANDLITNNTLKD